MTIWRYDDNARFPRSGIHSYSSCTYCHQNLLVLTPKPEELPHVQNPLHRQIHVKTCPICGWWLVGRQNDIHLGDLHVHIREFCIDVALRNLDLTDLSIPIAEILRYLIEHYADRFKIHPRKYEEVVASVFRAIGYRVRITAYSNDDGVDAVVLDGTNGDVAGVQAKRYRGKIQAHQIREFAGALVLNHMTRGIFVTTSSYTAGAQKTAKRFGDDTLPIDLWDTDRFYAALKIGRRSSYSSASRHSRI